MNETFVSATIVLVTDQFECERIIKASRVIADLNHNELLVLSVMKDGASANPDALEHLYSVSKEYDAQMAVQFSDSVQEAIVTFCRENRAVCAVTGVPENRDSVLVRLWKELPGVAFYVANKEGELHEVVDRNNPELLDCGILEAYALSKTEGAVR